MIESTSRDALAMYVIYDHPSDFPDNVVVRKWLTTDVATPTDEEILCGSLAEARQHIPPGLYRMPRGVDDDPVVLETWF